ncbi:MAG: hypothetical protein NTY95_09505 [Bacteroidia bacterium]|nr:hypothetical protein [Bacteroidia bacterium]
MKYLNLVCLFAFIAGFSSCHSKSEAGNLVNETIILSDTIQYHPVRISKEDGSILPWFSADRGKSYDTVIMLVWNFWKNMDTDSNGLKYYMNHQVWKPEHDMRGLGGDQINMALSSWGLLYAYTGYPDIIENMKYLADTYLDRSLSDPADKWPYIPYPYNTEVHSGKFDGDMRNGKGITQPDKAGSFAYELINLFKITGEQKYLDAAIKVAGTLSEHIIKGDSLRSPLPFRVNAKTGETGSLLDNMGSGKKVKPALYTSNWTGTMMLFEELGKLDPVRKDLYEKSFSTFLDWMKEYPLKTNKWGPFFEDVPGWSNTQTNAISFAMFILQYRDLFPTWKEDVRGIIDWTYRELGNHEYEKYKVTVMNEQTVYRVPGNSHSSRQASVELIYGALSGDTTLTENAIRTLNWATYTVASDGRNRYIRDDIWLTDGYGDYVRHYLRAMSAMPELAPYDEPHLLSSTSVITSIVYSGSSIEYNTFDKESAEIIRLVEKPAKVMLNETELSETESSEPVGWTWTALKEGGILKIFKKGGRNVLIGF